MSSHSQHISFRDGTDVVSWDASTVCAQCCDGVASSLPLEPHPLGIEAPSGLSRVAQLSAAHAVGVPFLPAYCHEQGGVVRSSSFWHGMLTALSEYKTSSTIAIDCACYATLPFHRVSWSRC